MDWILQQISQMNVAQLIATGLMIWFFYQKLDKKIEKLDQKLTAQIEAVDKKLTAQIEAVDKKLTAQIEGVDKKLTAQIEKLDLKIDTNSERIHQLEIRMHGMEVALTSKLNCHYIDEKREKAE